jgi:hypothetical protein
VSKKIRIDSLSSEISTLESLIADAKALGNIVGQIQYQHRLNSLVEEIAKLRQHTLSDNEASVALFFGGDPVVGSRGISAEFAGIALENFQNLISKVFVIDEVGEMAARGKIPMKVNSELMVTGLARGSFGFILEERGGQSQVEKSPLAITVDKVAHMLKDTVDRDESIFESLLEDLDNRTLIALREFFVNLDTNKATVRIQENDLDFVLDKSSINRGRLRTEATKIEEDERIIEGVLIGLLPEHKKFEFFDPTGNLLYGSVTRDAVNQFIKNETIKINQKCRVSISVRTVVPVNGDARDIYRLLAFLI